ncbi:MAG: hypothetical protein DMG01_07090 [Acidobacteria bacterium]|nr:MAG: hypothetical protein DMG01_07090 [Acidobacteriota bacterium]
MNVRLRVALVGILALGVASAARGQELGGAGTIQGTIKDPTGGVMQAVEVKLTNPVSGLARTTTTDAAGKFVFRNLPPNPYHITVDAQGFKTFERDVDVRSAVPIILDLALEVGVTEAVSVVGHAEDLLEHDPTAHTDIDASRIDKMPIEAQAGLNQVITLASPGVVADSNGFFHPVGDHAQTQFSIDNQPVTDQQSRVYSNQISPDAVQSMELITGVAPAEPRRPHRDEIGSRSAEADGQRLVRVRVVQDADRRREHRRRIAHRRRFRVVQRTPDPTLSGSAGVRSAPRRGAQRIVLQPLRRAPERNRLVPSEPARRAVRLRRAEHLRSAGRGAGAASGHQDRQCRAGLHARHRIEDAVQRQRLRAPRSSDVYAESRSAQRRERQRVAGSDADERRRQGRRRVQHRQPQPEAGRHDQRDEAR